MLRTGESVPGFGHPLYPTGDPRGALLVALAQRASGSRRALKPVLAVLEYMEKIGGEGPTIDLGLVAVSRALALPTGSAMALFAVGRSIGWIGHAIEQYASGSMIRPRARYAGVMPSSVKSSV
ncbi:MAG: citrate synthase, partial [bacterium]|nr:citrate synthase [Candidatus Kapabacteria bacterium]